MLRLVANDLKQNIKKKPTCLYWWKIKIETAHTHKMHNCVTRMQRAQRRLPMVEAPLRAPRTGSDYFETCAVVFLKVPYFSVLRNNTKNKATSKKAAPYSVSLTIAERPRFPFGWTVLDYSSYKRENL